MMDLFVAADADEAATIAAQWIATGAWDAVRQHGRFSIAFSGGRTPWKMFAILRQMDLPWRQTLVFQTDERIVPEGNADRNLIPLAKALYGIVDFPATNLHPMPVVLTDSADIRYADILSHALGSKPMLDVVHLGLGDDGHTASLIPDDAALDVIDRDVTISGVYQGHQRMTLTYAAINRAARRLFLITGASKRPMVRRLIANDESIPAGRITAHNTCIIVDRCAAPD